jgi:uncharacterized protein (TIGR02300 family)
MTTTSSAETNRALRGTKRVCQTCEVRFYDLSRDPIVCPACGAQYVVAAIAAVEPDARRGAFASKRGWRDRVEIKQPQPLPKEPETEVAPHRAEGATEEVEEESDAVADREGPEEDDAVLEPELDEPDVSGLVDHVDEPKER